MKVQDLTDEPTEESRGHQIVNHTEERVEVKAAVDELLGKDNVGPQSATD